jgi:hypothetical protein
VPDFGDARDALMELGLPLRLQADFLGGAMKGPPLQAMYFDTSHDLGFLVEIGSVPAGFVMPEPDYVYP